MRKYSLPLKIEVLSVANVANTKPLDVVGDEWLITDTYEDLFLKINHINEDGNYFCLIINVFFYNKSVNFSSRDIFVEINTVVSFTPSEYLN